MDFKRYRINKILNNNVITIIQGGKEVIIMHPGIGFKNKAGNYISLKPEYNIYRLQNKVLIHRFEMLLNEIPYECIELTQEIIKLAKEELNKELNQGLLISLADHIHFSVCNYQKGFNTGLASEEIKRFYREEYKVGLKAMNLINQHYNIVLDKNEASSIAFHLVNAEYGNNTQKTKMILESIDEIVNIIENNLNIKLVQESLNYSRLIIHLKFFIQRILNNENDETNLSDFIDSYKSNPIIENTIHLIEDYLRNRFDYILSKEEKFYLFIHITRNIK